MLDFIFKLWHTIIVVGMVLTTRNLIGD